MDNGSAQESGRTWQGDRLLQAVADRIGRSATIALLVSPIGVLFLSAVRLLIISDYNPVTASAIVSSGGYVNALLGTVIPVIPLLLPYIALILLFFDRVIPGLLALLTTALISPTAMSRSAAARLVDRNWASVIGANVIFWIFLAVLAAIVVVSLLVTLIGVGFNTFMRIVGTIVCIALIPTIAQLYPLPETNGYYTHLLRQPWLPAETITLKSGQRFIGYALADDGTWITILKNSSRTISYYLASDITGRQICEIGQVPTMQPLITLSAAGGPGSRPPICETSAGPSPSPGASATGTPTINPSKPLPTARATGGRQ